jgi:hypothetical protein
MLKRSCDCLSSDQAVFRQQQSTSNSGTDGLQSSRSSLRLASTCSPRNTRFATTCKLLHKQKTKTKPKVNLNRNNHKCQSPRMMKSAITARSGWLSNIGSLQLALSGHQLKSSMAVLDAMRAIQNTSVEFSQQQKTPADDKTEIGEHCTTTNLQSAFTPIRPIPRRHCNHVTHMFSCQPSSQQFAHLNGQLNCNDDRPNARFVYGASLG